MKHQELPRNNLTMHQRFQLGNLIQEMYTKADKTDAQFAVTASQALGFAVTSKNVGTSREMLKIPSRREALIAAAKIAKHARRLQRDADRKEREAAKPKPEPVLLDLLGELEKRIATLEDLVQYRAVPRSLLLPDAGRRVVNGHA